MDEGEYDGLSLGKAVPPIAESYDKCPGETVRSDRYQEGSSPPITGVVSGGGRNTCR